MQDTSLYGVNPGLHAKSQRALWRFTRAAILILAPIGLAAWGGQAHAKDPFDQLVSAAKTELEQKRGAIRVTLDWPEPDAKVILPEFVRAFPFVRNIDYFRETGIGPFGRYLLSIQQGNAPPYDIMHVAAEYQGQYADANAFVKPLFDYHALSDSLPEGWPKIQDAAYDPQGRFLATTAMVRGNVWNTRLVRVGREPTTWAACLDPMWRGKVVFDSRNKLQALQFDPHERERHLAWIKGLVANRTTFIDGQGPVLQRVAAGEYPIACGVNYHTAQRMIDDGVRVLKFALADTIPLELGTRLFVGKWSQTPATTQLFALWLATAGQQILDKAAYRGYPNNPLNRNFPQAQGKYIALCNAPCVARQEEFDREWDNLVGIVAAK
jgi:ABC-type Fe3+ transport system substrate-binding protein